MAHSGSDPSERGLLSPGEIFWRERHDWLAKSGYSLRPRYRPDWVPSWRGTGKFLLSCEDGIALMPSQVIDATKLDDGRMVVLKRINKSVHPHEVEIGRFLTSPPLSNDLRNHSCPILDVLQDPLEDDVQLLVMPLLREYNDPAFSTVGEAVVFFRQAFEGLQFMHEHHVAHRDCMNLNIMMDATAILPDMFHPAARQKTRDFKSWIRPYTRTARPVRYYWADFGLSRRYAPDDPNPLEVPIIGGDRSVPEFKKDPYTPCNPFRTDVYYVGNLIREDFLQEYRNFAFVDALIGRMVQDEPEKRPTMSEVVAEFKELSSKLNGFQLRARLVKRRDGVVLNLAKSVHHLSVHTIPHLVARRSPLPSPGP